MSRISFFDEDGNEVYVTASTPLPTTGSGGGGMEATDVTAAAPATWNSDAKEIGVDVGTSAGTVAAGDDSRFTASVAYSRLPVGTAASTVAAGNDSRFTNARTPTGSAGGDLTGTYPNPTIAAGKVTVAQLATATQAKLITQQPAIADLSAAPTADDFNGLLAALRAAGVIASA